MYILNDVMEMLDISERTVRRHLKVGVLTGTKEKGKWSFSDEDIEKYFDHYVVDGIIKLKTAKNFEEYSRGLSIHSKLTFYSEDIYDYDMKKVKRLSKEVSALGGPMDFKVKSWKSHVNVTYYGTKENILKVINLIDSI